VGVDVQFHVFLLHDYMKVSGQFHAPAILSPGKEPPMPTVEETEWALWPDLDAVAKRKSLPWHCWKSNPVRPAPALCYKRVGERNTLS